MDDFVLCVMHNAEAVRSELARVRRSVHAPKDLTEELSILNLNCIYILRVDGRVIVKEHLEVEDEVLVLRHDLVDEDVTCYEVLLNEL